MDSQKTMLNVEIRKILESEDDNGEKTIQLRKLFFKTIHPESFCPKCDNQMFFTEERYQCLNCGYDAQTEIKSVKPSIPEPKKGQPIPKNVENLLNAEQRKATTSIDKAEKIRRLADQVRSGNVPPPNAVDDQVVKGSDPNVGEVNWV